MKKKNKRNYSEVVKDLSKVKLKYTLSSFHFLF